MSGLSDLRRAADELRRIAAALTEEVRRGPEADLVVLVDLGNRLAGGASRLKHVLEDVDAALADSLDRRSLGVRSDLVDALSPSRRTTGRP